MLVETASPEDITACGDDDEILAGLAYLYIHGLIRVFRNPKGPTPSISPILSPLASFQHTADAQVNNLLSVSRSNRESLKNQVLHRDRHSCIFTNVLDRESMDEEPPHPDAADASESRRANSRHLQVINQSLTTDLNGHAREKLEWATSAAAILDRFSGIEIRQHLTNLDVHNLINACLFR